MEEKWRDKKQRDNDDGIKSNFVGAASSVNYLYIQFSGEYVIVQQDNEPYTQLINPACIMKYRGCVEISPI